MDNAKDTEFRNLIYDLSKVMFTSKEETDAAFQRTCNYYSKYERHSYSVLTREIFKSVNPDKQSEIDSDILQQNVKRMIDQHEEDKIEKHNSCINKLNKLLDHIDLVNAQNQQIHDIIHSSEEIHLLEQKLNDIKKSAEETIDKVNRSKFKKAKIYAEFVSILGIFTGIVVGIMGSLQTINSVFSQINEVPTNKLLVFSSFTAACIITILFLLMKWISVIVSQTFDRIDNRNLPQILRDNVVFATFMLLLISLFIFGGALRFEGLNYVLKILFDNVYLSTIAVLAIPLVVISVLAFVIVNHFSDIRNKK